MRETLRDVRLRVGRNVKRLRLSRGLSQEQLAELAGNSPKHVGLVESGKVNVTIDILAAIATGLSVNIVELFGPAPASTQSSRALVLSPRELDQLDDAVRIIREVRHAARRRR
jgi:transcriptional regulator with XRE-family HTH domain